MNAYKDLIKRLRAHNGWALNDTLDEAADAIENTSKAYQMMAEAYEAEVTKPQWIPVTERLPEEKRASYLCLTGGHCHEVRWTNNRYGLGESDRWGWSIFDIPQYSKVTHWMPLPEPPKED